MNFVIFKDTKGEWRWHLKAANGMVIAASGEGYKRKKHAQSMVQAIKADAAAARVATLTYQK